MKVCRGMVVVEPKLTDAETKARKSRLLRERRRQEREQRRGVLMREVGKKQEKCPGIVTDVVKLDDPHVKVQAGSHESTFKGKGRKCPKCGRRTNAYAGLLGRKHWLCPKCGWSDR